MGSVAPRVRPIPRSVPQGVGLGVLTGTSYALLFVIARVIDALVVTASLKKSGYPIPWTWAVGLNSNLLWPILGAAPIGAVMALAGKVLPSDTVVRGLLIGGLSALVLDRPAISSGWYGVNGLVLVLGLYLVSGVLAVALGGRLLGRLPELFSARSAAWFVAAWLLVALGTLLALGLQLTLAPGFGD